GIHSPETSIEDALSKESIVPPEESSIIANRGPLTTSHSADSPQTTLPSTTAPSATVKENTEETTEETNEKTAKTTTEEITEEITKDNTEETDKVAQEVIKSSEFDDLAFQHS